MVLKKIKKLFKKEEKNSNPFIAREEKYMAQNYKPIPVVLGRGAGSKVWDTNGNEYLDFLSAYSAVSAGHSNSRILQAMKDQLDRLDVPSRAFYNDRLGEFAEKLCNFTGMDMMLPMNTGAEAVETAIKAARRWGYRVKRIPKDMATILVSEGNFHGRTTTIVGFSTDEEYKSDFGPFDNGFKAVPYGDLEALDKALSDPNVCAYLTEPMQGENGIIIPERGWLKNVQKLCKKHNVLLILDEIQTGIGRTGRDFAFQHEIDKPDGLLLGKALGGGVYPVSAFLARRDVMELFEPGSHGSTFGGNPVAAAIGIEALDILREEKLADKSFRMGNYLIDELTDIKGDADGAIIEVRGAGLWVGVEFDPNRISARQFCELLKQKGVLAKETKKTVVRFAPPLTISREEIDFALEKIRETLTELGVLEAPVV